MRVGWLAAGVLALAGSLAAEDTGGDEFSQVYRYDLATGAITRLSEGGRSQNSLGPWSHAGDRMAYGSTRRNGADRDLYAVDPKDAKSDRKLTEVQGGGWQATGWSPDDKQVVAVEDISANESYLWLVDVASGEKRLLTPKGGAEKISYGPALVSHDGKGVYTTCDKDSEFQRLAYIDLASGKHTFLPPQIPWDVEAFDVSPDGKTIAFVTNEDGVSALHLLDAAMAKEKPAPRLPLAVIASVAWHPKGRDLGLSLSEARAPYDIYSIDVPSGKVDRWTESETGGLVASGFAATELVRFESFDGREISGLLYKPPARFTGPRPVVINIHGGPEGQVRPDFLGRANYLVSEMGVAMVLPNVRGSAGYGPAPRRVRRRARPEDARVPDPDFAAQPRRPRQEADLHRAGAERPARQLHGIGADGRPSEKAGNAGLVPEGEGRGPRLRQEEEPGLPVLLHGGVHLGVPAQVASRPRLAHGRAKARM